MGFNPFRVGNLEPCKNINNCICKVEHFFLRLRRNEARGQRSGVNLRQGQGSQQLEIRNEMRKNVANLADQLKSIDIKGLTTSIVVRHLADQRGEPGGASRNEGRRFRLLFDNLRVAA